MEINFAHLHAMVFVSFAVVYLLMDKQKHFGCANTATNALYYAVTTHTTTGFGDITAKTTLAKWVSTCHMIAAWIITYLVAVLLTS